MLKKVINENLELSSSNYAGFFSQSSNPMTEKTVNENLVPNYTQSFNRVNYDEDIHYVLGVVRILNNLAPSKMPIYNFNATEINGDSYYRPDGTLLLIREYDSELVRDYYVSDDKVTISRILEHDKRTGRLRAKIEQIARENSRLKYSITIFDEKINNKYYIMQLSEDGSVNNVSEFIGNGKSFQTLFRNVETLKPVRYLEGKESKESDFVMLDCLFNSLGEVVRIKKYSNKKEVSIDYTDKKKNITVKTNN